MVFFRPTKKWIQWLIEYADNRIIVDVGCGEGELLKQLSKAGCDRWIGVDLYIREDLREYFKGECVYLLEINTIESTLLSKLDQCLFLFCRPCHGGFVMLTLFNLPANAEVLYVGKPGNLYYDFDYSLAKDAILLKTPKLAEEKVYRISPTKA